MHVYMSIKSVRLQSTALITVVGVGDCSASAAATTTTRLAKHRGGTAAVLRVYSSRL